MAERTKRQPQSPNMQPRFHTTSVNSVGRGRPERSSAAEGRADQIRENTEVGREGRLGGGQRLFGVAGSNA